MTCITQPREKHLTWDKWNIAALCLGLALFPGLGLFSYSLALGVIRFLPVRVERMAINLTTT